MKLQDILLIGAGVYILSQYVAGYAAKNFTVKSAKLRISNLTVTGVDGQVIMSVQNTTPAPVPIQSIAGEILYSGTPVASYVVNQPFTIEAESTTTLPPIAFSVPFLGLSRAITQAIATGDWATYATIRGIARAGGVNIPFSYPLSPF